MTVIDTVLLKIASRCNLDCTYCYVYRMGNESWKSQPKKMSQETLIVIAKELALLADTQKKPFSVVFHGGEPLLVGPDNFETICSTLRVALPKDCSLHLQTNGLLLSDRILATCQHHDVGISISLDGPAKVHDASRSDHGKRGSHDRVVERIRKLATHPAAATLFTGILAVVDVESDPIEVYEYLKSVGAPSIDFLYRDGNHDVLPPGKANFHSTEYGEWAGALLEYYLNDRTPKPVRFLDDMIKIMIGGVGRKEGIGINDYGILVLETDGTITKNDTLKSVSPSEELFEGGASIFNISLCDFVRSNSFQEYHKSQRPDSSICKNCQHLKVCGGGMPSHRSSKANGLSNPTVFCMDQQYLIERIRWQLARRNVAA